VSARIIEDFHCFNRRLTKRFDEYHYKIKKQGRLPCLFRIPTKLSAKIQIYFFTAHFEVHAHQLCADR
jgi:hypothetical protein